MEKIIDYSWKCSFGTVSWSVGRLKPVVEIVGREVVRELRKNQFFNYLGDKEKIRGRMIVLQFILVKRSCFFEDRCNKSSFENFKKDAKGEGRTNESNERRKECFSITVERETV